MGHDARRNPSGFGGWAQILTRFMLFKLLCSHARLHGYRAVGPSGAGRVAFYVLSPIANTWLSALVCSRIAASAYRAMNWGTRFGRSHSLRAIITHALAARRCSRHDESYLSAFALCTLLQNGGSVTRGGFCYTSSLSRRRRCARSAIIFYLSCQTEGGLGRFNFVFPSASLRLFLNCVWGR